MKFIELPVSGHLINLDKIVMVQHEITDGLTKVIVCFGGADNLIYSSEDAEFLVNFCKGEVYE